MAELPPYPDSNRDTGADTGPDRGPATGMPRWVKVFGIIVIVLALLFAILHVAGRSPRGHTPPPSIIEHGVQQP